MNEAALYDTTDCEGHWGILVSARGGIQTQFNTTVWPNFLFFKRRQSFIYVCKVAYVLNIINKFKWLGHTVHVSGGREVTSKTIVRLYTAFMP